MRSEDLNQYAILVFLAVTVISSGCISNGGQTQKEKVQQEVDETQQELQELQACTSILIDIRRASSSEAEIRQSSGNTAVGEVEVTWTLQNGETATKTVSIDSPRGVARTTNSLSGTLDQAVANSTRCEGIGDTYP